MTEKSLSMAGALLVLGALAVAILWDGRAALVVAGLVAAVAGTCFGAALRSRLDRRDRGTSKV